MPAPPADAPSGGVHDRGARLDPLLAELLRAPGVLGAAVLAREGTILRAAGDLAAARERVGAMVASAMGAAEIALAQVDAGRPQHLVTLTDRRKLVVVPAGRDLLLVVTARADAADAPLLARLDVAARSAALAEG